MRFVCVDVDGVLLNMINALKSYLSTKNIEFIPQGVSTYSFKGNIGCDRSEIFKSFKDSHLYDYLLPYNNAIESVYMLQKNLIRVDAYTSSVNIDEIYEKRKKFCDSLNMKGNIYKGTKPVILDADALFDDCLDVHRNWIEAGYTKKLYLINATYNQEVTNTDFPYFDKIIRCQSFNDAVKRYLRDLGYEVNNRDV